MDWRELKDTYPGILDTLWLFPKRGKGGDGSFHGNFIPQVPEYLIERYTEPGDVVFDPMVGSGTTLDVGQRLRRMALGSDIVPVREDIYFADARFASLIYQDHPEVDQLNEHRMDLRYWRVVNYTNSHCARTGGLAPGWQFGQADLLILHPPYHDIIQFNPDEPQDVSNCPDIPSFLEAMWVIARNLDLSLKPKGYVALVCGDIYKDGEVVPLGFLLSQMWRARFPNYKLKNIVVKDIRGNEHAAKDRNLWYSRHYRYGTAKFSHEYVFILKKTRDIRDTDLT